MPGPRPPLVQAVQLGKRYLDGPTIVQVLAGLDLEVEAGERIAIVGESGVGKSTLLHLLGALDQPTGGRVLFDGVDVFARSEAELAVFRNREIGFVFQFHHLLGDFTALENVMLPSLIARQPSAATRARATDLLERVGLRERLAHRPGQLSGGEPQRVAGARAPAPRPKLLLADEPTGNLGPATGEDVPQPLFELNQEHGAALVVATPNDPPAAGRGRARPPAGGAAHELGSGPRGRAHGMTS